jgi:hypothetical protein
MVTTPEVLKTVKELLRSPEGTAALMESMSQMTLDSVALATLRAQRRLGLKSERGRYFAAGEVPDLQVVRVIAVVKLPICPHCGNESVEKAVAIDGETLECRGFTQNEFVCEKCHGKFCLDGSTAV